MIDPLPPIADVAMPWDRSIRDPVAALAAARARHGDTFVVASGAGNTEDQYLFVFSPVGVASFYALDEADASKGVADWRMLRRKLPDELFADRRTLPHQLFRRDDTALLVACVEATLAAALDDLGDRGDLDVFEWARTLGHRFGLTAWAGLEPRDERIPSLIAALDALDGADAFVHPDDMARVAASDKVSERRALAVCEELLSFDLDDRARARRGLFERIAEQWGGDPTGVARDVVLIHIASMSNLFAALGWAIVDVVSRADAFARVAAGEPGLAEHCALESIRLAQRSIMMRYVLHSVDLDDGDQVLRVSPGVTVATLLPLTNTSAAPGLVEYDPDRWGGRRLRDEANLPARELVTTFGHGSHRCPAQPFSLAAIARTLERLAGEFELALATPRPHALPAQIGGVARPSSACSLSYVRRSPSVSFSRQ